MKSRNSIKAKRKSLDTETDILQLQKAEEKAARHAAREEERIAQGLPPKKEKKPVVRIEDMYKDDIKVLIYLFVYFPIYLAYGFINSFTICAKWLG